RAGRPPGAGGAVSRCPGPAAGRLPGGDRAAAPGRAAVPGGGRADGPFDGGCEKALGAGRGAAAAVVGRRVMKPMVESDRAGRPATGDSRVARAMEEYLALLEGGRRPDRREFLD